VVAQAYNPHYLEGRGNKIEVGCQPKVSLRLYLKNKLKAKKGLEAWLKKTKFNLQYCKKKDKAIMLIY
jgi:hypothetical protein